jgi:hypothetical protein
LKQEADGRVTFERLPLRAGLPLNLFEDAALSVPAGSTVEDWLSGWHTDLEWLRAAHRTKYSNAIIGLNEQLARHRVEGTDVDAPGLSDEQRLLRRFRERQRVLVESDLLILANDHWNFDVRGFNPGGNHGSFFRISTHSTFMLAGGDATRIQRGLAVEEPYDSLSLMPTLLALTGQMQDGTRPLPVLWQRGFRAFPGRVVSEIFENGARTEPVAGAGEKLDSKRPKAEGTP